LNQISLVVWVATILFAFFMAYITGRSLSMRSGAVWSLSFAATVVTGAFLWLFAVISQHQPCKVSVTSPSSGSVIQGYKIDVIGKVDPPSARVTVIVRSETDSRWWVQEIVKPSGLSGVWTLTAHIGKQNEGKGETYEIVALASNDSTLYNLFTKRFLYEGLTLNQTPRWCQSELILIRRAI
jgi:hypothetical protein